jgi:hypothetical protein
MENASLGNPHTAMTATWIWRDYSRAPRLKIAESAANDPNQEPSRARDF